MPTNVGTINDDNINDAVSNIIYALDGNDTVFSAYAGLVYIYGGQGIDTIDYSDLGLGQAEIYGGAGEDTIDGGVNADVLYGGDDQDQITGWLGDDYIDGGRGNDFLYGNDGADVIYGGIGGDIIDGGAGNDVIDGGAWDDTIDGGTGADTMIGGLGNDSFVVDDAGDVVVEIATADGGSDTVTSSISFSLANPAQASGWVERLTLAGTGNISGTGNNLDNIIRGNGGANLLDGGLGADQMRGGLGDDRYLVDNVADQVIEIADQGADSVFTSVSYALEVAQHIETLATTAQSGTVAINLTGNELAQRINGNNGNNTIYGGAGDDLLIGYGGNDSLEGQAGADTLTGLAGADKFVFRYSTLGTSGADHITDFGADDFIYVDHNTTGPLKADAFVKGAAALDANDRFLYDQATGNLWFDQDGSGAANKVLVAVLDNKFALTASDIIWF